MFEARLYKKLLILPFLAMPFLAWILLSAPKTGSKNGFSPEKANLALRRTADGLLRISGDSTSRIPAIEQPEPGVWLVRLEQPFGYDSLPLLLQRSLDLYGIRQPYQVAVRRCFDATIDLGYHQKDYLESNGEVPCSGRDMPQGCHFIEVKFEGANAPESQYAPLKNVAIALVLLALAGYWLFQTQKTASAAAEVADGQSGLAIGRSVLDVAGQKLQTGNTFQTLTFRETKLLRLFALHPDRLLEREVILQEVWADEGVWVGRSVDVFVSRLRKKLAADPSVGIVAVHGVGYRLETGREG